MSLTIAYVTRRREPRLRWFLDSLKRQAGERGSDDLAVIIITPFVAEVAALVFREPLAIKTHAPKPCVWSGPHRLTSKDYFSASNSRNTAAALCKTDWIAYVDDLSVLGPNWLAGVRDAMAANYIALGCYQKVNKLVVEAGVAVSFEELPNGFDSRMGRLRSDQDNVGVPGSCLFGCSLALPMEALLEINGWPENLSDSLGFEDCLTGHVLQNRGRELRYDRRMFTLESEEDHYLDVPPVRWDPGNSPRDMSHAALEIALRSHHFDNDFGDGMNLRQLHALMLAGAPFPIRQNPQHHWWTGQPLSEL